MAITPFDDLYPLYIEEAARAGNRSGRWQHILYANGWTYENWVNDLKARRGESSKL